MVGVGLWPPFVWLALDPENTSDWEKINEQTPNNIYNVAQQQRIDDAEKSPCRDRRLRDEFMGLESCIDKY
jgi:hypothetical protein